MVHNHLLMLEETPMDITQLRYFQIIAETGSLTSAAEQLHISQPAMSAMLKKLEEELEVELFDRTPNRIHLNDVGEAALVHVNQILKSVDQMRADLLSLSKQAPALSIGFADLGVQGYSLPRFALAHPEIQVSSAVCQPRDVKKVLSERKYDALVTSGKVDLPGIQSIPFLTDRAYLSVPQSNGLIDRDEIALADIPAQPLLLVRDAGYFVSRMEKILRVTNPSVPLMKNDLSVTQYLIQTRNFLTTISTLSVKLRNDGTGRKLIPFTDPELTVQYYVTFLSRNRNKLEQFLAWAEDITRKRGGVTAI